MLRFLSVLFLITGFMSGCNIIDNVRVKGNGKITTKNYDLKGFDRIDVEGAKSLFIKQDSAFSVRVETDENLLNHIRISASNGELEITSKDGSWLQPTDEVKIFVSLPSLKKLDVSGASVIKTENKFTLNEKLTIELSGASEGDIEVRAPDIRIQASGASTITIRGESRNVVADVSGASTLEGFELKAENNSVDASGASTANVFASISLKAKSSGASNIKYRGNPSVNENTSGASSVKKEP